MKKFIFLCAAAVALSAQAEVITLDLTTATDLNYAPIQYETKGVQGVWLSDMVDVWDSTYSPHWTTQYIYTNGSTFSFAHTASTEYGAYSYWNGFTLSKVASDTLNQFGCAAKGGVAGVGTPFLVSYENGSIVSFDAEYYPQELQVCQSTYTLQALRNGYMNAKKFTDKDTLALTIYGLDNLYNKMDSLVYYLAIEGKFNSTWTPINLTSLGKCMHLQFALTSTDNGQYGMNTPIYFALDCIKISDSNSTTDNMVVGSDYAVKVQKVVVNGQLYIVRDGVRYTIQGQHAE